MKQTKKLQETIECYPIVEEESVCRELLLVKVVTDSSFDNTLVNICDKFGAQILDISENSVILELCGTSDKIDEFLQAVNKDRVHYDIKQVCRTGIAALKRGVRK